MWIERFHETEDKFQIVISDMVSLTLKDIVLSLNSTRIL